MYRAMAQKESHHKEAVDSLHAQLEKTRKQHDELTALSRDQVRGVLVPFETNGFLRDLFRR